MVKPSTETFRAQAFGKIAECRQSIREGRANLSGLELSVRNYCTAVTGLAAGESRMHEPQLQELMREVEALEAELIAARNAVQTELAGLGRLKQANVAYHRSDHIGPVTRPKKEEP